jgi:hypothetical protein
MVLKMEFNSDLGIYKKLIGITRLYIQLTTDSFLS